MSSLLTFDVVIATRNRPEALALSIPLILGQSRQPERLIVIDSSDNHAPVAETVARAARDWPGEVIVDHTSPGSSYQRNRGLAHVRSDIVVFPDDDSLMHPGTTEAIMDVYERDPEEYFAGVCAADAREPPPRILSGTKYAMSPQHERAARFGRTRNKLVKMFNSLEPAMYVGNLLKQRYSAPKWFDEWDCVLVEYMTGYRMSFRTNAIKSVCFDETLKDYAYCEDFDASCAIARHGALVGARRARIYHHRFPGGRGDLFKLGVMRVLNRSYVVLKNAEDSGFTSQEKAKLRQLIKSFYRLKVLLTLARFHRREERDQLRGVLSARRELDRLLAAPREELPQVYTEAMRRALGRRPL